VTEILSFEKRGDVALIRMDDGKANALSPEMVRALTEAFGRAEREARAVVLSGRPTKFCAGFDLKVMMSGPANARALVSEGGELFMRVYEHPQPVIAAVTGHALAGGVLLAACCDERIGAAGDFKLGLNEVAAGMPVPILAHELARDRLDPRELVRATLFAHIYDPESAARAGWLDRVVAPDAVEDESLGRAEALSKLPAGPYALTKRSLRRETIRHIRTTMQSNMDEFSVG
jgi:enoyl-CoA hydratase